jgi:hypothetical protein
LDTVPFERALAADDLQADPWERLPAAGVPRVVLGNAGGYTRKAVRAAWPGLAQLGMFLDSRPRTARNSTASSRCSSR